MFFLRLSLTFAFIFCNIFKLQILYFKDANCFVNDFSFCEIIIGYSEDNLVAFFLPERKKLISCFLSATIVFV